MTFRMPFMTAGQLRPIASLALLAALAACGSHNATSPKHASHPHYSPQHYYPPPGPPSDPWGPYIKEASGRFNLPEPWIRGVMKQESGGQQDVISWAGAIGLMQVMPDTYADLQDRYHLGDDPFDPHNNILAGTAYLREMYDRFGSPGFLAAYNAGPNRVDQYVNNGRPLPAETVHYVAAIAPRLGNDTPMTGPLAVYGGRGVEVASTGYHPAPTRYARAPTPAGCDTDAAYNPDGPCRPVAASDYAALPVQGQAMPPLPVTAAANVPHVTPSLIASAEAAPGRPAPQPPSASSAIYQEPLRSASQSIAHQQSPPTAYMREAAAAPPPVAHRPIQEGMQTIPTATYRAAISSGGVTAATAQGRWGIQVGAYGSLPVAQAAAEHARAALPNLLGMANIELARTTPFGNQTAFQARLTGLPQTIATDACNKLSAQGLSCIMVPPNRT